MTKETLVAQLEAAKALTSVVSIDNVITLIQSLEPEVRVEKEFGFSQTLADRISENIQRTLDYNSGQLVDRTSAEFELCYDNRIELYRADIDVHDVMGHINAVLDEFIVEEEAKEVIDVDPEE